jgi:hypothetical protein
MDTGLGNETDRTRVDVLFVIELRTASPWMVRPELNDHG